MMSYEFGDLLLLSAFPFSDFGAVKKRPALVLTDSGDQDIILCRVTSEGARDRFDFGIEKWKGCGLILPSCARLTKIATLSKRLILKKLGRLGSPDRRKVRALLREMFLF